MLYTYYYLRVTRVCGQHAVVVVHTCVHRSPWRGTFGRVMVGGLVDAGQPERAAAHQRWASYKVRIAQ